MIRQMLINYLDRESSYFISYDKHTTFGLLQISFRILIG